jgi:hypothetical protein
MSKITNCACGLKLAGQQSISCAPSGCEARPFSFRVPALPTRERHPTRTRGAGLTETT